MTVRWWWYGKLAVFDLAETGRQIGEKLFTLLSADQQRELAQFVLERTTGCINFTDLPYQTIFRGKYSIPQKMNHPLTETRSGDLYFCLEQEMRAIGNNLNQIARKAHSLNFIDEPLYRKEAEKWNQFMLKVKKEYLLPKENK